jgi:hypothetical protein
VALNVTGVPNNDVPLPVTATARLPRGVTRFERADGMLVPRALAAVTVQK